MFTTYTDNFLITLLCILYWRSFHIQPVPCHMSTLSKNQGPAEWIMSRKGKTFIVTGGSSGLVHPLSLFVCPLLVFRACVPSVYVWVHVRACVCRATGRSGF
jgi:hypothetical protein